MNKFFKYIFLLFGIIILNNCKTQRINTDKEPKVVKGKMKDDYIAYFALIDEAINLNEVKNYKESALKYEEAFKAINDKADTNDRYNASCSFALSNNLDKAFYHLFIIANKDKYSNLTHIKNDTNLNSLHNDKRWSDLLDLIKENKAEIGKNFDEKLIAKLDIIYQNDQNCRSKFSYAVNKYGFDSDKVKVIQKECIILDSINQIKVSKILDENGWLGTDKVGERGNITLFLVLQHADRNIKMQLKYLPLLKEAVKNGKANPMNLAMLEDRTRVSQGKKQIYGTQIGHNDKTGEYYVQPIEDPLNVDKRRKEVGLSSMSDYAKQWGIEWKQE